MFHAIDTLPSRTLPKLIGQASIIEARVQVLNLPPLEGTLIDMLGLRPDISGQFLHCYWAIMNPHGELAATVHGGAEGDKGEFQAIGLKGRPLRVWMTFEDELDKTKLARAQYDASQFTKREVIETAAGLHKLDNERRLYGVPTNTVCRQVAGLMSAEPISRKLVTPLARQATRLLLKHTDVFATIATMFGEHRIDRMAFNSNYTFGRIGRGLGLSLDGITAGFEAPGLEPFVRATADGQPAMEKAANDRFVVKEEDLGPAPKIPALRAPVWRDLGLGVAAPVAA